MVSTAAFHARARDSFPGLSGLNETKMFLPHPLVELSIVGGLRDREVACSASDLQCLNFESCVWRGVSCYSSHNSQGVLLAQFSLYVHKSGLKSDSFHFATSRSSQNGQKRNLCNSPLMSPPLTASVLHKFFRCRDDILSVQKRHFYKYKPSRLLGVLLTIK